MAKEREEKVKESEIERGKKIKKRERKKIRGKPRKRRRESKRICSYPYIIYIYCKNETVDF